MKNKRYRMDFKYGTYTFKLYEVLEQKKISHNKFMRDTETAYSTIRRYAYGNLAKVDLALLDRWCNYLHCTPADLIEYK